MTTVGGVVCPPAVGGCTEEFYSVLDRPAPPPDEVPVSFISMATPAYFDAMRIPLRQGRAFTVRDREGASPVAIVNDAFARRWWPSGSAIGRRIKLGGPYREGRTHEIVGVAGDVSQFDLDGHAAPEIHLPFAQAPQPAVVLMMRTVQAPGTLATAVRHAVARLDPQVAVQRLQPFEQTLGATLDRRRFGTALLTLFAGLALMLAFVGVYGLLNARVAARQGEIAVRMAHGADRTAIVRWAAEQAFRLCAAGVVIGGVAGWVVARSLEGLLFAVSARNPTALALAVLAVVSMAVAAAAWPLWRATRVNAPRTLLHA